MADSKITAAGATRPPGIAAQAATESPETPPADPGPEVCAAFSVGWLWEAPSGPDGPPELVGFSEPTRVQILRDQVRVHLNKLRDVTVRAELDAFDHIIAEISDSSGDRGMAMVHLEPLVLGILTAADLRLGKAYRLGRGIAAACRTHTGVDTVMAAMSPPALAPIVSLLDDLSSSLPPHSAHPVAESLERWSRFLEQRFGAERTEVPEWLALLGRQGELWRGLLSGDKPATDLLEIDNYLDAVDGLASALALASERGRAFSAHVVDRLAEPAWGAVLDQSVADAVTLLPDNPREYRGRRTIAIRLGRASQPYPPAVP